MGKFWFRIYLCVIVALTFCCSQSAKSQRVAIKSNALLWATATPNLGAEMVLGRRWTLDWSLGANPCKVGDITTRFAFIQPELKYWLHRPMTRHYIGVAGLYLENKLHVSDKNREGVVVGAGITYGYSWVLSPRWNFELNCGLGCAYYRQYKYNDNEGKPSDPNFKGMTIAPIKLGVCFSYILK